jgi:hypothetical protein
MHSLILRLFQRLIMRKNTLIDQRGLNTKENTQEKITRVYKNQQENGETASWGLSGTENTQKKASIGPIRLFAMNVAYRLLGTLAIVNTAQQNAGIGFNSENTARDIQILGRKRVYDLMVESDHEFFVNNILVHNCLDSLAMQLPHARAPYRKHTPYRSEVAETNPAI